MKIRLSRLLGPLLILLLFGAAVWLLCTQLTAADLRKIVERLDDIVENSPGRIVAAVALTALNYVILIGYDLLAIRYVGEKLSLRRVALASFTAYTCGYNFGSTLAGTSVRYRLYSAWGVPTMKILQLLVILALTFWFGMFFLGGVVFIAAPLEMPEMLRGLCATTRPMGIILLGLALAYVGLSALHYGSVKLWRWRLPVPPFKLTVYQVLIASADLLLVAGVLYVLWPASEQISYFQVLGVYMLVFVTGVLTHVPGGYGVMEAVLISIIPDPGARSDVIASWLLFRVVYYIAPLLCSLALLGCYEFMLHLRAGRPYCLRPSAEPLAESPAEPEDGGRSAGGNGASARSPQRRNPVDS